MPPYPEPYPPTWSAMRSTLQYSIQSSNIRLSNTKMLPTALHGQWMKVAKCISAPCLAKSGEDTLPIWGILLFCSSDLGKMYYWLKVAICRFSTKRNSWLRVAIFHSIASKLRMPSVTAVPVSNSGKALC